MGINTGIGVGIGIPFKNKSGDKPYISPDVLSSLCGVWVADQNTNNSTYRNIIKNKLPNRGGDFEILNAAYKLNSGYGLYNYDYTTFNITAGLSRVIDRVTVEYYAAKGSIGLYNIHSTSYKGKIKLTGVTDAIALKEIIYFKVYTDSKDNNEAVKIYKDGEYDIDIKGIGTDATRVYFYAVRNGQEAHTLNKPIYIEQVPRFEGAFVTDGVNDVIRSKASVSELLCTKNLATSRVTVVSMMYQNTLYNDTSSANNSLPIEGINTLPLYNNVTKINKTGIYGYTYTPNNTPIVLNNIMGDKNDYNAVQGGSNSDVDRFEVTRNKFPVAVAWYWTFISDRVLTSFEIEQVIAYYNLDKYVTPSVYYDVKKQGITNDNHSQFSDKLIDYSGNKRNLQLYNIGWGEESGIGKYATDYTRYTINSKTDLTISNNKLQCYNNSGYGIGFLYIYNNDPNCPDYIPSYKVKVNIENVNSVGYYYVDINGERKNVNIPNTAKEYTLPESYPTKLNEVNYIGFTISNGGKVTIEQIGEYDNHLVLDGVNDYGQYVDNLGLKDYTFIMNRSILKDKITASCRLAKSGTESYTNTPFLFESFNIDGLLSNVYSYGFATGFNKEAVDGWSYLSTYNYNGTNTARGAGTGEGNGLFIGSENAVSNYTPVAISHVLLYPYSLNKFLIDRQLRKLKAGTLYEGMVQFISRITTTNPYKNIQYFNNANSAAIFDGDYLPIGTKVLIRITPASDMDYVSNITINGERPNDYPSNDGNFRYTFVVNKSINKIDITIDQYIKFEDISQPYPALLTFYDKETNEVYDWGSKIKVGTVVKVKSVTNLFKDLYAIDGYFYNGKNYSYKEFLDEDFIVNRDSIKFSVVKRYLLDNNPPKVIYSPQTLKLTNDTYKLLGYIPDISGNDNNGIFNNFAFKDMSGAGGYVEDFSAWNKYTFANVTYNKISISRNPDANWIIYTTSGHVIDPYEIKISGIPADGEIVYKINNVNTILVNGINKLEGATVSAASGFYITKHGITDWKDLVIEQLPKYGDSIVFDGVDDFVTIPSLNHGFKEVLLKLNYQTHSVVYDQRDNPNIYNFAISTKSSDVLAYRTMNTNGVTYINGILNTDIKNGELINTTHNIVETAPYLASDTASPIIGCDILKSNYSKMALYDLMLFDNISSNENIYKLNEIVK